MKYIMNDRGEEEIYSLGDSKTDGPLMKLVSRL